MFTLGVVLLVIAGVVTADIVLESSGPMPVAVAGHEVAMEDWRLFLFGMATGVLVVVAATLIAVGFSRDRRRRRDERLRRRELVAAGVPNVAAPMPATGPSAGPVQGPPATPVSGPIAVPGQSATAGPTTRPAAPAGGRTGPKGTPPAAQVTGSWQAIPAAARSDRSAPPDARTAPTTSPTPTDARKTDAPRSDPARSDAARSDGSPTGATSPRRLRWPGSRSSGSAKPALVDRQDGGSARPTDPTNRPVDAVEQPTVPTKQPVAPTKEQRVYPSEHPTDRVVARVRNT